MQLPITILYGTLFVLVTLLFAVSTSLYRLRNRIYLTPLEKVPHMLLRLVRAHGNSAEWLAGNVFLIAFLELQHANPAALNVCALVLLVARILHSLTLVLRSRFGPITASVMYGVSFWMAAWSLHLRLAS
jgi:uncharacterized membrane protein YecN with MAPEG domain